VAVNYDAHLLPNLSHINVFLGRIATLGLYQGRYALSLYVRPGQYVCLRRPVKVQYGRPVSLKMSECESPSSTKMVRTTNIRGTVILLGSIEGTLLHWLSPRLAERVEPWAVSPVVDGVVTAGMGVAVVTTGLMFAGVGGAAMGYASFLLYLPAAQALTLLDTAVLRLLCGYFDFWYLLGNALLALLSAAITLKRPYLDAYAVNVMTTAAMVIFSDALRLTPMMKLRNALVFMVLMLTEAMAYAHGSFPAFSDVRHFAGNGSLLTFWMGRTATLALFFGKYVVHQMRRPHTFTTICKPLRPEDGAHRNAETLSKDPSELDEVEDVWRTTSVNLKSGLTGTVLY
jgi:hypothetical protein